MPDEKIQDGTTSACAENTINHLVIVPFPWNYLRVRGEYSAKHSMCCFTWELPPRARRILNEINRQFGGLGTTSACAENTRKNAYSSGSIWNYLRVRGEYANSPLTDSFNEELPPRARRILTDSIQRLIPHGTTSACAENTVIPQSCTPNGRNYLRVRGEYPTIKPHIILLMELPPRARRIPPRRQFSPG